MVVMCTWQRWTQKAFDHVHHLKLFNVLSDRKIPFFVIKVIVNWYSKMFASVRWNAFFKYVAYKKWCAAGSIMSPSPFNLYVNVIIDALSKAGYGCFIHRIYMGCIVYADDIILLSASIVTCCKKYWIIVFIKGNNMILFLTFKILFVQNRPVVWLLYPKFKTWWSWYCMESRN